MDEPLPLDNAATGDVDRRGPKPAVELNFIVARYRFDPCAHTVVVKSPSVVRLGTLTTTKSRSLDLSLSQIDSAARSLEVKVRGPSIDSNAEYFVSGPSAVVLPSTPSVFFVHEGVARLSCPHYPPCSAACSGHFVMPPCVILRTKPLKDDTFLVSGAASESDVHSLLDALRAEAADNISFAVRVYVGVEETRLLEEDETETLSCTLLVRTSSLRFLVDQGVDVVDRAGRLVRSGLVGRRRLPRWCVRDSLGGHCHMTLDATVTREIISGVDDHRVFRVVFRGSLSFGYVDELCLSSSSFLPRMNDDAVDAMFRGLETPASTSASVVAETVVVKEIASLFAVRLECARALSIMSEMCVLLSPGANPSEYALIDAIASVYHVSLTFKEGHTVSTLFARLFATRPLLQRLRPKNFRVVLWSHWRCYCGEVGVPPTNRGHGVRVKMLRFVVVFLGGICRSKKGNRHLEALRVVLRQDSHPVVDDGTADTFAVGIRFWVALQAFSETRRNYLEPKIAKALFVTRGSLSTAYERHVQSELMAELEGVCVRS